MESHPLRVRGLKQHLRSQDWCSDCRILYGCVDWNPVKRSLSSIDMVASFTGAWIETEQRCVHIWYHQSHPLRVRGLKQRTKRRQSVFYVASFTGAWIETHSKRVNHKCLSVASFTGAWIETSYGYKAISVVGVASFTGAWIETYTESGCKILLCRILYGCVDWNIVHGLDRDVDIGRILYGCVDWNMPKWPCAINLISVASFTGAWIETQIIPKWKKRQPGRILYGCVDWNSIALASACSITPSHPLRMRHVPFSERSNHHRFNLLSEFVSLLRITILSIIINKIQTTTKRKCHYSSIDCSYVIYLY